jgi:hypothetical protein
MKRKPTARMGALLLRLVDAEPAELEHRPLWQLFELAGASTVHGLRTRGMIRGGPGCHSAKLEVTPTGLAYAERIRPRPWRAEPCKLGPPGRSLEQPPEPVGLYSPTRGLVAEFRIGEAEAARRAARELTRADLERAKSFD